MVITAWIVVTVVSRSATIWQIETFMTLVEHHDELRPARIDEREASGSPRESTTLSSTGGVASASGGSRVSAWPALTRVALSRNGGR